MPPLQMRLREISFHLRNCRTRLPFRFGVHTLTVAPLCLARVLVETADGRTVEGFASDLLVPKWFEKKPGQAIAEDWRRLLASARETAAAALDGASHGAVFSHWHRLWEQRVAHAPEDERLMRGEGVSLVERAMIDGACRAAGVGFVEALKSNLLGFDPRAVASDLVGWNVAASLPTSPRTRIHVRHTVGLLDALRADEISPGARVNDGLPESFEEDIERYGLTYFKLKLSGRVEGDIERLLGIARVLRERVGSPRITIDGNEQFGSVAEVVELLERLGRQDLGRELLSNLILIEQPLTRSSTFDATATAGMGELSRFAPCIIDEADADLNALPRAAELGYGGVSVKNCKGVFRALVSFGRCARSGGRLIQSGEDLTNLPVVALQQDLATAGALGLTHVERNGHHYFHGLRHLPPGDGRAALANHSDLYEDSSTGPQVRIEKGMISTGSLHIGAGYAYSIPMVIDDWIPAEQWSHDT